MPGEYSKGSLWETWICLKANGKESIKRERIKCRRNGREGRRDEI